jgi:hypothetical protein
MFRHLRVSASSNSIENDSARRAELPTQRIGARKAPVAEGSLKLKWTFAPAVGVTCIAALADLPRRR